MRIRILGSAAAEAVPSLWCQCEVCRVARQNGGKDLRRRTSYIIDEDTMIDFGPDAFWQTWDAGVLWEDLKQIIFTHQHSDHCNPVELGWRRKGFAQNAPALTIYGSPEIRKYCESIMGKTDMKSVDLWPDTTWVEPENGVPLQAHNMEIFSIPARHSAEDARNYILTRDGKSLLIAHDSGFWTEEAWNTIAGRTVDCVIFDGTCALKFADVEEGHMGAAVGVRFRDELLKRGILKKDGLAIVNHFSHNGNSLQADLEAYFTPCGIEVGYDGKIIDL